MKSTVRLVVILLLGDGPPMLKNPPRIDDKTRPNTSVKKYAVSVNNPSRRNEHERRIKIAATKRAIIIEIPVMILGHIWFIIGSTEDEPRFSNKMEIPIVERKRRLIVGQTTKNNPIDERRYRRMVFTSVMLLV